jgi:hypothetical protein
MFPWLTLSAAALLVGQPEIGRDTLAVGSWIVDSGGEGDAAQHVAMTLSSQGAGVIAFTCRGERASLVLGLNKTRFRAPVGSHTLVRYDSGSERAETQATVVSEETVHLDEGVTRDLLARTGDGTVLTLTLPSVDDEAITLVFRPVESAKALAPLKAACRIPG